MPFCFIKTDEMAVKAYSTSRLSIEQEFKYKRSPTSIRITASRRLKCQFIPILWSFKYLKPSRKAKLVIVCFFSISLSRSVFWILSLRAANRRDEALVSCRHWIHVGNELIALTLMLSLHSALADFILPIFRIDFSFSFGSMFPSRALSQVSNSLPSNGTISPHIDLTFAFASGSDSFKSKINANLWKYSPLSVPLRLRTDCGQKCAASDAVPSPNNRNAPRKLCRAHTISKCSACHFGFASQERSTLKNSIFRLFRTECVHDSDLIF